MAVLINDTAALVVYTATAAQTVFAVPFEFFAVGDLVVQRAGATLTYAASPANASQYSVTGANVEGGGSITLGAPGATLNDRVLIYRNIPIDRRANYPETGPMAIRSLNQEQARQIAIMQQLRDRINESLSVPVGSLPFPVGTIDEGDILGLVAGEVVGLPAITFKGDTGAAGANGTNGLDGVGAELEYFGDGSDGNVTISSGTTTLTRDMHYNNLTISGTGVLQTRGYRVFVKGTLDITAASARSIVVGDGIGSLNGGNAVAHVGGNSGTVFVDNNAVLPVSVPAGNGGANGTTGAGAQGSALTAPIYSLGYVAGAGGAGGAVGGTAGGVSRAAVSATVPTDIRRITFDCAVYRGGSLRQITAGMGAPGGSSGAGDGVGQGGGGGGGGAGGCTLIIAARTINRSGATAASAISVQGGNGGNGGPGQNGTNRGGGGGGGGGSGGWLILIYRTLTGSTATNCLDATGGNGGNGANGTGTGGGGNGGSSGSGGRLDVYDIGSNTQTITTGAGSVAGSAASGATGGSGGSATLNRVSL